MLYILPIVLLAVVIIVTVIALNVSWPSDTAAISGIFVFCLCLMLGSAGVILDSGLSNTDKYTSIQLQYDESKSAILVPSDTEKSSQSYFTKDGDKITFWIEDKESKEMKCQTASIDNVVVKYCGTKETPHVETTPSKCVLTSKPNFWTSAPSDWLLLHKYNVGDVVSDTKVNMTKSVKITYILYVPEGSSMNAVNSVSK